MSIPQAENAPNLFAEPDYIVITARVSKKLGLPFWFTFEFVKVDLHFYFEVGIDELRKSFPQAVALLHMVTHDVQHTEIRHKNQVLYAINYND